MRGIADDIQSALHQAGIAGDGDPGSALSRGWDYWHPGTSAADGRGIARTPHPIILGRETLPLECRPIFDAAMTAEQLQAGIWRQCLIRPGDPDAVAGEDAFAISDPVAYCSRAEHLVALIGHAPRDLALWLNDLRRTDPSSFAFVLAKDFRTALVECPKLASAGWPDIVQRQWTGGEGDYLPPFFVAALYAELARLALNQAGLLELSFDAGVELTTTRFLDRMPLAGGPHEPRAITHAIAMAPFQSVALSPPDMILGNHDRAAAKAWSTTAAASIALAAGLCDGINLSVASPEDAIFLRAAFEASPNFWTEERAGHGYSRQPRPAATRWGLNWRHHAATGLVELMATAREWNARYRPSGPRLDRISRIRRAHALSVVGFSWLAEFDTAAARSELARIDTTAANLSTDEISPLSIDDRLGGRSGDDLLRDAESGVAIRPAAGAFGYTARYQAHLWLDVRGDDIAHYRRFQQDAVARHARALEGILPAELRDMTRVPRNVADLLRQQHGLSPKQGGIGHNQPPPSMTLDIQAARGAQNAGMMLSALSTNPILEMLIGRNRRKRSPGPT